MIMNFWGLKMRTICKKINNYFTELSTFKFIVAIVLVSYLAIVPFTPFFYLYEKYIGKMGGADNIKASSMLIQIIFASIITPILETLIFQYGAIEILSSIKIFKGKML